MTASIRLNNNKKYSDDVIDFGEAYNICVDMVREEE